MSTPVTKNTSKYSEVLYLNEPLVQIKTEEDEEPHKSSSRSVHGNVGTEGTDSPLKIKNDHNSSVPRTPTPFKNALAELGRRRGET